jgi:hypothetical protein
MTKARLTSGPPITDQMQIAAPSISELEIFIRDVNFGPGTLGMYKTGLVLQETGFIDVSEFDSGPIAHARYHVITSKADEFRPGFVAYGAWTMPRGCFFKVLDVLFEGDHVLITLLHIPAESVPFYALNKHTDEDKIVANSRQRFQKELVQPPNPALVDDYWLRRTAFPLGIADDGTYFFQFDYGKNPKMDPLYKRKGLFRKWFAKS